MAARIVEGLFTCRKRWALEAAVAKTGHRWRAPAPMCAAECVARILCWLDDRCDPKGRIHDATADDVELAAGWVGKPGALVEALVSTGWIDRTPAGMEWHDYGSLNRITLSDRLKKQGKRGTDGGTKEGTGRGTRNGACVGNPTENEAETRADSEAGRASIPGDDSTHHGSSRSPESQGSRDRDRGTEQGTDRGTEEGTKEGTRQGTSRGRPSPSPGNPQKDSPPDAERPLAPMARAPDRRPDPETSRDPGKLPTLDPRLMWSPERKQFVPRPGCEPPPKRVSTGGAP